MPTEPTEPPLRIGIAGLGRQGNFHVERIGLRGDCTLVAAYDIAAEKAVRMASRVGRIHRTWPEFLNDRDVELVLIATPTPTHAELACAALAAGKHVAVEKPLCQSRAEADAIAAAAEEAGRSVSVLHTRRWDSDFRTPLALVEAGKLGPLISATRITRQFSLPLPVPVGGPHSAAADWSGHADGALLEFGTHYFDQLLKLTSARPVSVNARVHTGSLSRGVEDEFRAWIEFDDRSHAHVEFSQSSLAPLETGWVLCGQKGGFADGRYYRSTEEGELVAAPVDLLPTDLDGYYAALVRHLRQGEPLPCPLGEARRVVALIDAARESAVTGEIVRLQG